MANGRPLAIDLPGAKKFSAEAMKTVLANANPTVVNDFTNPRTVWPDISPITVSGSFSYEAPPYSLTVIRMKAR